jgi:streptogramin lyase
MLMARIKLLTLAASFGAGALVAGCEAPPTAGKGPLLFFPAPPAEPRVQFLTWASGSAEVEETKSSFEEFILGEEREPFQRIRKPYGVAARDGVVYVCDTKGLCLCRLDFKDKTYSVLGVHGPGQLRKPINVVIDPVGYKFVADPIRKQIVVFGPDDDYVTAFNIPKPCHPVDVAIWENELYVLDNDDTCQIVVLDRQTGEVLRTFGGPGQGPGQFKIPSSLCFGPDGFLYVSDTLNWRIQKLTRDGEAVWTKGTAGYRLGEFGRPRGVRVGPDGVVYSADAATEIIQMLNSDGEVLMHLGGPGSVPGALVLPSTLAIDATSLPYFKQYVHEDFNAEYLLFVASQFGQHLISVYAFGSFPEGYKLSEAEIATLPKISPEESMGPVEGPGMEGGATDRPGEEQQPQDQD